MTTYEDQTRDDAARRGPRLARSEARAARTSSGRAGAFLIIVLLVLFFLILPTPSWPPDGGPFAPAGAPSVIFVGSYFPVWLVCGLLAAAIALALEVLFTATGWVRWVAWPLVFFSSLGIMAGVAIWLVWTSI